MKGSIVYSNLWETWAIQLLIEFSMRAKKWDILLFTGWTLSNPTLSPGTFLLSRHIHSSYARSQRWRFCLLLKAMYVHKTSIPQIARLQWRSNVVTDFLERKKPWKGHFQNTQNFRDSGVWSECWSPPVSLGNITEVKTHIRQRV